MYMLYLYTVTVNVCRFWLQYIVFSIMSARSECFFLLFYFLSGLTAIATYLLTKELWNDRAGLFAACFIAIG